MQIIVLGMHRSGTSAVTRLINMMGAHVGQEGTALGFSQRQNPKGFWERRDVIELNEDLLQAGGASWDRVSSFQIEAVSEDARARFERGAREVIQKLDLRRPWVLKEPRLCVLFPVWRPLLETPVCVFVHRHPLAVARSLERRDAIPVSVGIALWESHTLAALDASRDLPRFSVSFEAVMEDPASETERIWRRLGEFGVAGLRRPTAREVEAFIEPKHDHHGSTPDDEAAPFLYPQQLELARSLRGEQELEQISRAELSRPARRLLSLYDESTSRQQRIEELCRRRQQLASDVEATRRLVDRRHEALERLSQRFLAIRNKLSAVGEQDWPKWTNPFLHQSFDCARRSADVIVCVHNALDDVRRCLDSVVTHTRIPHRLILVNDGSGDGTTAYLREFSRGRRHVTLLESAEATGYTRAANRGLAESRGDVVVLLNSDTVVTSGWLPRIFECFDSAAEIGIVGPLSNAATYQSVPKRFGATGDWQVNRLPVGWDAERMAGLVAAVSRRRFPRVPFVNGFCYAVRRKVLEAVGRFDEETFPRGYGEENDFSLRTAALGWELAIADHAYVFHAMSKSYSHETRRELSATAREAFQAKHDPDEIQRKVKSLDQQPDLAACRRDIADALSLVHFEIAGGLQTLRVLFVLPVSGGGGGVHSVVQEVCGMRSLGCDARVAVPAQHLNRFHAAYPSLDPSIFVGTSDEDLVDVARDVHVLVGTIFTSIRRMAPVCREHPEIVPAYYVQDYEPLIVDRGSEYQTEALASYTLIPGMACFAKTRWLCDTIARHHGVEVYKVEPSLDRSVYYPPEATSDDRDGIRIAAMVRPSTPYRGPGVTMEVLAAVSKAVGERVRPVIFGCEPDDPEFLQLERGFEFENLGVLRREQVADLLRSSHIFVDFSAYQAFGRTALEAMACGCAVIVPEEGGTDEYAADRENALVVDTSSFAAMRDSLLELVRDGDLRQRLASAGLRTAEGYSVHRAARSELALFKQLSSRKEEDDTGELVSRSSREEG